MALLRIRTDRCVRVVLRAVAWRQRTKARKHAGRRARPAELKEARENRTLLSRRFSDQETPNGKRRRPLQTPADRHCNLVLWFLMWELASVSYEILGKTARIKHYLAERLSLL